MSALPVGAYDGRSVWDFLVAFPDAEVHSFEPLPEAFASLKRIRDLRLHAHANIPVRLKRRQKALCSAAQIHWGERAYEEQRLPPRMLQG